MVEIKNLVFEYRGVQEQPYRAIDDVSMKIDRGEFVVIIGHNGSGKSTLAKNLNAILLPTSGDVIIGGYNTKDEEHLWDIRKTAGMVFQNPDNQIVASIVEEDMAFGPENLGIEKEEIRRRVDYALERVKMTEFRKRAPHNLSGGQKQRVAIGGIIAMRPECIILDEPTAMLDPNGRKEVMKTIRELNRTENITIIHITHFMDEAIGADRVYVMDHGKILMQGRPKEVFRNVEELKAVGLDVPHMTELAFLLAQEGMEIEADILSTEEMVQALCR
ncbi:energy-coupling factor transporter ATPase [Filifactor villosus]|uniref:Energy-coupling factor transporter ATPase n=1 Tax=Filifactor villosus TaxID=29374 RepID=A0ABV9QLW5_9FIRM